MAKRRRLSPARTDPVTDSASGKATPFSAPPIAGLAGDAAQNAAAAELAETLTRARLEGRMVLELPLDRIDAGYLVRDRIAADEDEMTALMTSLAARGQQTPIEVTDLGDGQYGLISGWRRLEALRRLGPEGGPDRILALLRTPQEAGEAYLAMVEENEIRVGLGHYERARIVWKAVEQEAYPDVRAALQALFHAASRSKRSKIGSFLTLVEHLDGVLAFPETLGERLGLSLAKALEEDPSLADRIRARLTETPPKDGAAEQAVIAEILKSQSVKGSRPSRPAVSQRSEPGSARRLKVTLRDGVEFVEHMDGSVTLQGDAVDAAFRADLVRWISETWQPDPE
ncbi:ParB-like chromosome segregation protein Spo0J [Palleronia aestuarii]|uniref:ParB-like chromosome segregation protein Spo0J n=1 Tax=Palleronia aestuarii TaxID=568105 RepID=A0A2W7MZB5_9RHOB|nr:ParB N-terminal domain-containing protein [Palleronia aestuarii]PZX13485.1 ParB-like chromosome segregation protein Spo0J [Palleronia aestuarii]